MSRARDGVRRAELLRRVADLQLQQAQVQLGHALTALSTAQENARAAQERLDEAKLWVPSTSGELIARQASVLAAAAANAYTLQCVGHAETDVWGARAAVTAASAVLTSRERLKERRLDAVKLEQLAADQRTIDEAAATRRGTRPGS